MASAGNDSTVKIWYLNSDLKKFDLYNSITYRAESVLSVDFANNSSYILACSSEGKIRVTSINNQVVWGFQNNINWTLGDRITIGIPYLAEFAEFDESGTGFVLKAFPENESRNTDYMTAIYVDNYENVARASEINKFDYIQFSPGKEYIAYTNGDDVSLITRNVNLVSKYGLSNNYRLIQMNGQKPFFSPDLNYVFTKNSNSLESWFINVDTISGIAIRYYYTWGR